MTSPTLTMPTAITATVEEVSSSAHAGQRDDLTRARAHGAKSEPRSAASARFSGSVASRPAERANVPALIAIRMCGSNTSSNAPASAGPSVPPRSSSAE